MPKTFANEFRIFSFHFDSLFRFCQMKSRTNHSEINMVFVHGFSLVASLLISPFGSASSSETCFSLLVTVAVCSQSSSTLLLSLITTLLPATKNEKVKFYKMVMFARQETARIQRNGMSIITYYTRQIHVVHVSNN